MRTVPETHAAVGAYLADLVASGGPAVGPAPAAAAAAEAAEAQAARLRQELDAILATAPSAIHVFAVDGAIVRTNAVAAATHGGGAGLPCTLRELWERDVPLRAVASAADGADSRVALEEHPAARALRGEAVRGEAYILHGGGAPRLVETFAGPVRDADGRVCGAVLVERDATERARLAQALEEQFRRTMELNERVLIEAEQLERMVEARSRELLALQEATARERRLAAVGQLAAGVMHDVNNALNPIIAAAYLLRRHADDPARVRDYAERIGKAAETGAATASRVGRFIRQDPNGDGDVAVRHTVVDLAALADEVLAMAHATWAGGRRRIAVEVERCYAPACTARGLPGEIREALLNLVQNAVDAMPDGGRLTVATGTTDGTERESWVAVSDTGVGMTDDVRDRAFEPFFTTKGAGGSGLGLAEVYGIMRRHRGRAEIASAPGAGTTVRLVFPHAAPGERAWAADPGVAARGRAVLVVEDDPDGREFLHALLASEGHAVTAAAGLQEARARLGLAAPAGGAPADGAPAGGAPADAAASYDVLITDVGLPDGNGLDLVREARERWPHLRIGIVTGWEAPAGPGVGADRTLRKPLRADELLAFVAHDHPEEG